MNTPYTEEQKQEFKNQFKARRTRQLILIVPFALMLLGMSILRKDKPTEVAGISAEGWGIAFLILVVGLLVYSLKNWRCPACNGYLGRTINPRFCQKCGVQLGS